MKFTIQYATKERKYISETTYQNVSSICEVEAIKIMRYKIGSCRGGVARYVYSIEHIAPVDAEFKFENGHMYTTINRLTNKHFNPKKFVFQNNVCIIQAGEF